MSNAQFVITIENDKIKFYKHKSFYFTISAKLTIDLINKFIEKIKTKNEYLSPLIVHGDDRECNFIVDYDKIKNCCIIEIYSSEVGPRDIDFESKFKNSTSYNLNFEIKDEDMIRELEKLKIMIPE
jgi:hypothetical protein